DIALGSAGEQDRKAERPERARPSIIHITGAGRLRLETSDQRNWRSWGPQNVSQILLCPQA
ncbi:hypothetical protein M3P36_01530, partial [Altererythrobacter sp. KTW20L]|uniref:hypothetical protein n=1 Tax=Altererythrobacter sp. KTW20L TaxID=2942210 RepID=UPI0020BE34E6